MWVLSVTTEADASTAIGKGNTIKKAFIVGLIAAPLIAASAVQASDSLSGPARAGSTAERMAVPVDLAPPPSTGSEQIGREVLALVNAARSGRGLAPLAWSGGLGRAAHGHSTDQAGRNQLSHTGGDGSNVRDRVARTGIRLSFWGECVGAGFGSARGVVDAWLASPPHADIIFGEFTLGGAGMATSASGTNYWTLVVGR